MKKGFLAFLSMYFCASHYYSNNFNFCLLKKGIVVVKSVVIKQAETMNICRRGTTTRPVVRLSILKGQRILRQVN